MKKIRRKLIGAFSVLIVTIMIISSINYYSSEQMHHQYEHLLEQSIENVNALDNILVAQNKGISENRGYMIFRKEPLAESAIREIGSTGDSLKQLEQRISSKKQLALLHTMQENYNEYWPLFQEFMTIVRSAPDATAPHLSSQMVVFNENLITASVELKEMIQADVEREKQEIHDAVTKSEITVFSISIIALIIAIIMTLVISRNIATPIQQTTEAIEEMADGHLNIEPLHIQTQDETRQMADALNRMLQTWRAVIQKMGHTSSSLATQSEELSANSEESLASSQQVSRTSNDNLRQNAQQNAYLEQSVQSINEVTLGIDQIAESNENMLESSTEMGQFVTEGVDAVHRISTQMNAIDTVIRQSTNMMEEMAQKSTEIQEVSALISGIAEQTNLLALNAAIEAARAGENGKGFAVVAEEVRNLAEESQKSSTKIEEMIQDVRQASERAVHAILDGQTKVAEGLKHSNDSLTLFGNIESSVGDVTSKIETVSAAVQQIQAMAAEVLTNTDHLRELAQTSASSAEETSQATDQQLASMEEISHSADTLARLADDLRDEVEQFKL